MPRDRQTPRTKRAWIAAAVELYAEGQVPPVAAVAPRADVPSLERVRHAVLEMGLQDPVLHACERSGSGVDLGHDLHAVAALLDHLLDPAHLSFNAPQAMDQLSPAL